MNTEQKNRKGKLLAEAAIYGLLSMIYGSLFFFGALYPQYGFSTACIEEEENEGEEMGEEKEEEEKDPENREIVYKSFFLERLREWF